MNDFISKCKSPEAEKCKDKIIVLKILKQKKSKEINQRHITEKENLKLDDFSDVNYFNYLRTQKF